MIEDKWDVVIVYPPFHDPDMQYLAPALLATAIERRTGVRVGLDDLNLRFYQSVIVPNDAMLDRDDLNCDVDEIVDRFSDWIERLENCFSDASGIVASYRKLHVPFDWRSSAGLAAYLVNNCSDLERKIDDLVLQKEFYKTAKIIAVSIGVEDQIVGALTLCKILRNINPTAHIVLGGNIISRFPGDLAETQLKCFFDSAIKWEGEAPLSDLISQVLGQQNELETTLTNDLLQISFRPDDPAKVENSGNLPEVDWARHLQSGHFAPARVLPILASRKCYWAKCDFCAIHSAWSAGFSRRTIPDVLNELEYVSRFTDYVRFVDEDLPPSMLLSLARGMEARGINLVWEAYSRFEPILLREEVCRSIADSGCAQLFFGLENIGLETALLTEKGAFYTRSNIEDVLRNTARVGILNYVFVLLNIPGAPLLEEEATVEFLVGNPNIDAAAIGSYVVDRLSPIEQDPTVRAKYGIRLSDIGDLTTEVGYELVSGPPGHAEQGRKRAASFTSRVFERRADLALASLLTEEQRLFLAAKHGRTFAKQYMQSTTQQRKQNVVAMALRRSVDEKIDRVIGGDER